jgi:hypothetical protein
MTRFLCGILVLVVAAGCASAGLKSVPTGGTSGPSSKFREPASRVAVSHYVLDTDQGVIDIGRAKLSRKRGHHAEQMLAFRTGPSEWGILRSVVRRVRDGGVDVDVDTVPIVSNPMAMDASDTGRAMQGCNIMFGHARSPQTICPGDTDTPSCPILDGACVNTNGDCLYSSPCGKNGDGSGGGIGRIYFPGNGAHCNYDFGSDIADCYFDLFGGRNGRGPVDLYVDGSYKHTATAVQMLCQVDRLTDRVEGDAWGHYWDGKTYGFTPKLWHSAMGRQFWGYPVDFPLPANPFGNTFTPPPPQPGSASLDVNYYGFGIPFFTAKAGFCTHAGPQA